MAKRTVGGVAAGSLFFLVCTTFLILLSNSEAAAKTPLPFEVGEEPVDGWVVSAVATHPEYVDFTFKQGGILTDIEIIYNENVPGEWATEHYRIQPGVNSNPPEILLKSVIDRLRVFDNETHGDLLVRKIKSHEEKIEIGPNSPFHLVDQQIVDFGDNPETGSQTLALFKAVFYPALALLISFSTLKIYLVVRRKKKSSSVSTLEDIATIALFWLVQITPLLVIGFLSFDIYESVRIANNVNPKRILADLRSTLSQESGLPFSLKLNSDNPGYYLFGWEPQKSDREFCPTPNDYISLERQPDERAIYIFGGSPVILPDSHNSMVDFTAQDLSERMGQKVRSYNFGMCGITCSSVANRAIEALKLPPDLMIIYNGENDYSYADNFISRYFYIIRNETVFERLMYVLYYVRFHLINNFPGDTEDKFVYPFYRQDFVEPVLNRILRDVRLLKMDESLFMAGEDLMFENYLKKMSRIISAAEEAGVPVLIIPATSNFHERPFGVDDEALHHYVKALRSRDYNERAYHFMWAREGCYFNKLIRSKIPLYDRLYNLEFPNLYVFDLEYELLRDRFPFDFTSYMDQAHMRTKTHQHISHYIADYIMQNHLLDGF